MRTRFYNGKVLSLRDGFGVTGDEVWVEGGRILYVGPGKPWEEPWDREIDLHGNLLMPGFKNAHTHSPMTFLRSYADDLPLLDWLQKQVFPMEAKLTAEDVYELAKLAVLEYLSGGVTANFDMYMFPEADAAASRALGFRTVLCGCVHDHYGSVEKMGELYEALNGKEELLGYRLGFHAEYTCGRELLREVAELSAALRAPVYTHNSESLGEVEGCLARYGATPTVFLESLGLFEHGGGGFHCVHMSPEDLEIFQKKGLWAISNPGSNTKLASGIAPLWEMRRAGIGLALGTDGPASNNCLDMFREMFLATGLQKLRYRDASAMEAETVLWMAASGGALAMGLPDCDCIAPGKRADLLVLNLHRPNMQPENNLVKNIVYSGSKENVKLTMVNGRVLYEDGAFFVGEDPEAIYRKAAAIIGRMRD